VENKIEVPVLEIRGAQHCNLSCKGCSQLSPFQVPYFPDLSTLRRSMIDLKNILKVKRITVLGGEPLLNQKIDELCRSIRDVNLAEELCVTTNGLLLHETSDDFWSLVDEVQISIYPSTKKAINSKLEIILDKAYHHRTALHLMSVPVFNHIGLSSPVTPKSLVNEIYNRCYYKFYTHTLYEGNLYKCAPCVNSAIPKTFRSQNSEDGIQIHGGPSMYQELLNYLSDPMPLSACHYCLGSSGSEVAHEQMTPMEKKVFMNDFELSMLYPR